MIDLHSHSVFSDGSETPERVVELAAQAGCTAVALTDHDTTAGLERARISADRLGVALIRGCEVSCAVDSGTLHVLCYFIEPGENPLEDELARLRDDRSRRNELMVERLRDNGIPITYEEVVDEAGGTGMGRPHFAAVLMRKGFVRSIAEAFDTYLAKGAPGYVDKTRLDAATVIELTKRSGGVAVVAHPLSLGLDGEALTRELAQLSSGGLAGMECYYGRYDRDAREALVATARRLDLVATGGTDFHGSYKPDLAMGIGQGDLNVPDSVVDELDARRP